jgi:3-isopropylmalate/(R)-2-methylmalate dehydratase small subunit
MGILKGYPMPKDSKLKLEGKAFVFGNNVDTDVIIPARYLNTSDPDELAGHCMEDLDEAFSGKVRKGDIIVAGENFGCGSSREHAPLAIQAAGVACVIASTFARIFYRNAINIGLPILELVDAPAKIKPGQRVEVDLIGGTVTNRDTGDVFQTEPFPPFMQEIINAGGLIPHVKHTLEGTQ